MELKWGVRAKQVCERKRKKWIIQRHTLQLLHTYRWDQSFNGWLLSILLWWNQSGNVESDNTKRHTAHCLCGFMCMLYRSTIRGNGINVVEANVLCMCKQANALCMQKVALNASTANATTTTYGLNAARVFEGIVFWLVWQRVSFYPITTVPASQPAGKLVNVWHASWTWHRHTHTHTSVHIITCTQNNNVYLGLLSCLTQETQR